MTDQVDKLGPPLVLAVHDVSRAHFYGVCVRDMYVEPPEELHRPWFSFKSLQDVVPQGARGAELHSAGEDLMEIEATRNTYWRTWA
eukprot:3579510-Amphidinium_carterae.1